MKNPVETLLHNVIIAVNCVDQEMAKFPGHVSRNYINEKLDSISSQIALVKEEINFGSMGVILDSSNLVYAGDCEDDAC